MAQRLGLNRLHQVPNAHRPKYNLSEVRPGIVHLGIGAFHRAHQAVYTDDLLASGHMQWGVTGVSMQSDAVRQQLSPQDYLYSVREKSENAAKTRVIGSIREVLALPQAGSLNKILAAISDTRTQVVSLTITEKGYCHNADGDLDLDNPKVAQDLQQGNPPTSAPGLLALALNQRFEANAGPLTILSCDNLSSNGEVTQKVVEQMLQTLFPKAAAWFADNLSFPSTMVDRIVPQTTAADLEQFSADSGYADAGLVVCEPYSQWVIEDKFAGTRPPWDQVGAQFVSSVQPYEQTKLRFLNATHSALAYLGLLAGYDFIHQSLNDASLARFARYLMDVEIEPAVSHPPGFDLDGYKSDILTRFSNAEVPYRTSQVASDGSQKLPQRILPSMAAQHPQATPGLCLVVAAWIQCLAQQLHNGSPPSFNDPLLDVMLKLIEAHPDAVDLVQAIAEQTTVLDSVDPASLVKLADAVTQLRQQGAIQAVNNILES